MPATFDQLGLRFDYPENWTVERETNEIDEGENEQVIVSSPETAFWHLSKHPPSADLESLFDDALATLRSEYKEMEVEPASELVDSQQLLGFDVNFICLDLTITCWLRGLQTDEATYLLLCQAEDRELDQASPVFRAMLASLLRNLA